MKSVLDLISRSSPPNSQCSLSPHQEDLVQNFIEGKDPPLLCSYYIAGASGPRLALCNTIPRNATSTVTFFLRTGKQGTVTHHNFKDKVGYGWMSSEDLGKLVNFVTYVYRPSLLTPRADPKTRNISHNVDDQSIQLLTKKARNSLVQKISNDRYTQFCQIDCHINKFSSQLVHLSANISNTPLLCIDHTPHNELDAVHLSAIEEVVGEWIEQLSLLTFQVSHVTTKPSLGLLLYIQQLAGRERQLDSLVRQVECCSVQRALSFLCAAQSPLAYIFTDAVTLLKESRVMVQKQRKHLGQLEVPLQQLYQTAVEDFSQPLYDILVALYLLHSTSCTAFHSELESVVVRASWDVAKVCVGHLQLDLVFTSNFSTLSSKTYEESPSRVTQLCCLEWITIYTDLYNHFKKKEETPGDVWLPSPSVALQPVNLLLSRCYDLHYIWTSMSQLSRNQHALENPHATENDVGEFTIEEVEEEMQIIDDILQEALSDVSAKIKFAVEPSAKEWLKYFDRFKHRIEESEHRYQCVLVSALLEITEATAGLALLHKFRPMLERKALQPVYHTMIQEIMELVENEMEEAEREYVFRVMKATQPDFSYSQSAQWCLNTNQQLQHKLQTIQQTLSSARSSREESCYKHWTKTSILLTTGAKLLHEAWLGKMTLSPTTKRLQQNVLTWRIKDNRQKLVHNFDRTLSTNLEEAQVWLSLKMSVPNSLAPILKDSASLQQLRKLVERSAAEFNSCVDKLSSDELHLFDSSLQTVVASFMSALTSLKWTNKKQIEPALSVCSSVVREFIQLIAEYSSFNEKLYKQIEEIKSFLLYKKPNEFLFKGDEFIKDFLKQISGVVTQIRNMHGGIENDLHNVYCNVLNSKATDRAKTSWIGYVEKVDEMFLASLKELLLNSMIYLEKVFVSCKSLGGSEVPLFYIRIQLVDGRITSCPLIDNIWQTATHMEAIMTLELNKLPCLLRRFNLDKAKAHDHKIELQCQAVNVLQLKITEQFELAISLLQKELMKWEKFLLLSEDVDGANTPSNVTLDEERIRNDCNALKEKLDLIQKEKSRIVVKIFSADCEELRNRLRTLSEDKIQRRLESQYQLVVAELEVLNTILRESVPAEETTSSIQDYLTAQQKRGDLLSQVTMNTERLEQVIRNIEVLKVYKYKVPGHTVELSLQLKQSFEEKKSLLAEEEFDLKVKLNAHKKALSVQGEQLKFKLKRVDESFKEKFPQTMQKDATKAAKTIDVLVHEIGLVRKEMTINTTLASLQLPQVKFDAAELYLEHLTAAKNIWSLIKSWESEWQKWKNFTLREISIISFQSMLANFEKEFWTVQATLKQPDSEWEAFQDLRAEISSVQDLVAVLELLQEAPLQQSHWHRILYVAGQENQSYSFKDITLQKLHAMDSSSFVVDIEKVVLKSKQDRSCRLKLEQILEDVRNISNVFTETTIPGVSNLHSIVAAMEKVRNIQKRLDDLYISLLNDTEYDIRQLKKDIWSMIKFLKIAKRNQQFFDKWVPFFNVNDVRCKVLHMTSIFDESYERWKILIEKFTAEKCLNKIALLPKILSEMENVLVPQEDLEKSILEYIYSVREFSPRMNFLSDSEILNVVSQVNSVSAVRPYLYKLYGNVGQIKVQRNVATNVMEATAILSSEGECVQLSTPVPIVGPVPSWLERISVSLTNTLRENVKQCKVSLKAAGIKLDEILKTYPLQVCFIALQLMISGELIRAKSKSQGGQDVIANQDKFLKDVCTRFNRILNGTSTQKALRLSVRLFYVVILGLKEQLFQIRDGNVNKLACEESLVLQYSVNKDSGQLMVHFGAHDLTYCWQYQGLKRIPVFTSQMSNNLMQVACNLKHRELPAIVGNRYTRKTETIRLISVLLGHRHFIVEVNPCFTADTLTRCLMAAMQTPTLLHLTNLHQLTPEVTFILPELLEQVCAVRTSADVHSTTDGQLEGIHFRRHEQSRVILECNLTMSKNNTRQLLEIVPRPVCSLLITWVDVIEVELTSRGFKEAKNMAKLMTELMAVVKLSVSHLPFYQFGPSLINLVLTKVTALKKETPLLSEQDLILNCTSIAIKEQLKGSHIQIFEKIYTTMHPDVTAIPTENGGDALLAALQEQCYYYDEEYLNKIVSLKNALESNSIIGICGFRGNGKTTAITLAKRLCEVNSESRKIRVINIDPYMSRDKTLMGSVKESSLVNSYIHELIADDRSKKWLVFQSNLPMGDFIETFFSIVSVEDSDIFCYVPEKVKVPSGVKIVIELCADDVAVRACNFGPCHWLWFDHELSLVACHIRRWLHNLSGARCKSLETPIKQLINEKILQLHRDKQCLLRARVFTTLMDAFLNQGLQNLNPGKNLDTFVQMAFAWSFEDIDASFMHNHTKIMTLPRKFLNEIHAICCQDFVMTEKQVFILFLCSVLMEGGIPISLEGAPGCGKTTLKNILKKYVSRTSSALELTYGANTSPRDLQNKLRNMVENSETQNRIFIFLDDLHCTRSENHRLSILNFLLRCIAHNADEENSENKIRGFIHSFLVTNRNNQSYHEILDCGSNSASQLVHKICVAPTDREDIIEIASQLFQRTFKETDNSVKCLRQSFARCLADLLEEFSTKNGDSASNFGNLTSYTRQINALFAGFSLTDAKVLDRDGFLSLFAHEVFRILADTSQGEIEKVKKSLEKFVAKHFNCALKERDYVDNIYVPQVGSYNRTSLSELVKEIIEPRVKSKGCILSNDFCLHVVRIMRGLACGRKQREVDMSAKLVLLLGPHGVGKRTAAMAAASCLNIRFLDFNGDGRDEETLHDALSSYEADVVLFVKIQSLKDIYSLDLLERIINFAKRKKNTSISVIFSCIDEKETEKVYQVVPYMFSSCTIDVFKKWTDHDWTVAAQHIITEEKTEIDCSLKDSMVKVATEVHLEICRISQEQEIPPSHFLHFFRRVISIRGNEQSEYEEVTRKLEVQMSQYQNARAKVAELTGQLQDQRAQVTHVQQSYSNSTLKLKNIRSEQGRLEEELIKRKDMLSRQKEEYARIKGIIEHDMAEPRTMLKNGCKQLNRITVEDFEKVRQVIRPGAPVETVFELVLTLAGLDSTWNEAKKQMQNGLDFISKICKTSPVDIEDSVLLHLQANLANNDELFADLKEDNPTVNTFLEWLVKFENFARIHRDCHSLQLQADAIGKDVQETEDALSSYERDLTSVKIQQQVLHGQLMERENQLDNAEELMKTLEFRMQASKRVMTQLGLLEEKWDDDIKTLKNECGSQYGDAIMKAAKEMYFGNLCYSDRRRFEQYILRHLSENGIVSRFSSDKEVFQRNSEVLVQWLDGGLSSDRMTVETASILLAPTPFIDVVYDPNAVLLNSMDKLPSAKYLSNLEKTLKKSHKTASVYYISQEMCDIPDQLNLIFKNGKDFFFTADQDYSTSRNNGLSGQKFVIFFSNKQDKKLPGSARLVDNGSEEEGLKYYVCSQICSSMTPSVVNGFIRSQADLLQTDCQLRAEQEQVLQMMEELESFLLSGSSSLADLERASVNTIKLRRRCEALEEELAKTQSAIESHEQTSVPLCRLFQMLERLSLWRVDYLVPLSKFLELVVRDMTSLGQPKWGRLLDRNTLLASLAAVLGYLQVQISGVGRTALSLSLVIWYYRHLGRTSRQHIDFFADRTEKYSDSIKSPITWLDDERWNALLSMKVLKEFRTLADDVVEKSDTWCLWYTSEYAETRPLPEPYDKKVIAVSKLILIAKLRPDRLAEAADIFITKIFKGTEGTSSEMIQKCVLSCQASTAIYLDMPPDLPLRGYMEHLQALCYPLVEPNVSSIQMYRLTQQRLSLIRNTLINASIRGQWVVLLCNSDSGNLIESILTILKDEKFSKGHKRFQSWFVSSREVVAGGEVLAKVHRFSVTSEDYIKESIESFFTKLGDGKLALYNTDEGKWLLLAQTLTYLAVKSRHDIEENCFVQGITRAAWQESEGLIREHTITDVPSHQEKDLKDQIARIYLPAAATERERSVLRSIIRIYFSEIRNIPEKISSLTHYSLPSSCSLDSHKTQLEFIYKAKNHTLAFTSPKTLHKLQMQECMVIKKTVADLFQIDQRETQNIDRLTQKIKSEIQDLQTVVQEDGNFIFVLLQEELKSHSVLMRHVLNHLHVKLNVRDNFISSKRDTDKFGVLEGIELNDNVSREMLQLQTKSSYLKYLIEKDSIEARINLSHFKNPLAMWSSIVREFYPNWHVNFVPSFFTELIYVPKFFRSKLNRKVPSSLHKHSDMDRTLLQTEVSKSEESAASLAAGLCIESLKVYNAVWDEEIETLLSPDKIAVLRNSREINMLVVPKLSAVGAEVLEEREDYCDIPVYTADDLSQQPILYISLPSQLSQGDLLLAGTRLTLA